MKNYTGQSNFTGILICQENRANGPRASKTIFFWGKGWKSVNLGETNRHMKQKTTMLSVKSCLGMRICAHTHVDLLFSPLIAGIRKSHICHFFFFSFSEQKNPCLLNPCQMNQTCVRKAVATLCLMSVNARQDSTEPFVKRLLPFMQMRWQEHDTFLSIKLIFVSILLTLWTCADFKILSD